MTTLAIKNTEYIFSVDTTNHLYTKLVLTFNDEVISCLAFNSSYIGDTTTFLKVLYTTTANDIAEREFFLMTEDDDKVHTLNTIALLKQNLKMIKSLLPQFKGINVSL